MDEYDAFIIKMADIEPAHYIASKRKKIARLLKKCVFKVVIANYISKKARIFNSHFLEKIKNSSIDMVYEKNQLLA